MKIINIQTQILKAPLKKSFVTALRRVDELQDLIVIIECDDGSIGLGEGAPTPVITGETIGSMIACIDYIKPHILNKDMDDFDDIIKKIHTLILKNTTAKSALEIALFDLKAQAAKCPLYKLLGGTKTSFTTDITISMGAINEMVTDCQEAVALGYDALKIKIGDNPKLDAERIIAIHSALDPHTKLRLDANQGWTAKQSVELLQALEKQNIIAEFIEQPIAADDLEGFKYIKERVQTPLLADESIFSLTDARYLLDKNAIDFVNIKLAKTAGISQALKLADLSNSYGVQCMIGCMLEGPISIAAGVHLASAKANIISLIDLDAVSLLASHPLTSTINFNESQITLGEENGLGITQAY